MSINIIVETQEETERLEDELMGKAGQTHEDHLKEEPPMTHAELVAVAAHMAFNISTLLKDVDNKLSDEALSLSEKLLSRYEEKKVGLEESEIEELKKRILG